MTQPIFGVHAFAESPQPNAQDAFDLITGEVLQAKRSEFPERSFLVDENVQAVADSINVPTATTAWKESGLSMYAGKWIIVAFNLGDHRSRFGMEIVDAQTPAQKEGEVHGRVATPLRYGLTCIFDTELWGEKLATVKVGERLTVMGAIERLDANSIRLRHCEFV